LANDRAARCRIADLRAAHRRADEATDGRVAADIAGGVHSVDRAAALAYEAADETARTRHNRASRMRVRDAARRLQVTDQTAVVMAAGRHMGHAPGGIAAGDRAKESADEPTDIARLAVHSAERIGVGDADRDGAVDLRDAEQPADARPAIHVDVG